MLIVDEASRVRDELWATISPMLAAAPAAQQILLSTPAGASGEFHRAWTSHEDWERVQITADQCPRISTEHLAAERIRLGDALYRQEYFGASPAIAFSWQGAKKATVEGSLVLTASSLVGSTSAVKNDGISVGILIAHTDLSR